MTARASHGNRRNCRGFEGIIRMMMILGNSYGVSIVAHGAEPVAPVVPAVAVPPPPLAELPAQTGGAEPVQDEWMALPDARLWQLPPPLESTPAGSQRPIVLIEPAPNRKTEPGASPFRAGRDPLLQTSQSNAMGGGEMLSDGLGGVPGNLVSPLLPPPEAGDDGMVLGPLRLALSVGANAVWQQTSIEGLDEFDQSAVSVSASMNFRLGEPATGRTMSLAYSATMNVFQDGGSSQSSIPRSSAGVGNTGTGNAGSFDEGDRFNQQLSFRAQYKMAKLELGLGVGFTSLSGQNRDVGREISRDLLTVSLTSRYPISPKTSVSWDLALPVREFDGGIGSSGITSEHFVDYEYSPRTSVGVGGAFGWLNVDGEETQTFQRLSVRAAYEATAKLRAVGSFGYETRQAGDGDINTPVFTFGGTWAAREGTDVSLTADRRIFNSATEQGVNYTSTSVMLRISQRLGERCVGSLGLGWENGSYETTAGGVSANRVDNLFLVQAALAMRLTKRLTCSVNLGISDNDSNVISYRTVTAGVQCGFTF